LAIWTIAFFFLPIGIFSIITKKDKKENPSGGWNFKLTGHPFLNNISLTDT
jgi:hypothetical protein